VVGAASGTVDAPPFKDVCVKLPSGDVMMHSVTPCEFQNTDVRAPSGTVAGDAQISTFASGSAAGVVVAFTGGFVVDVVFVGVYEPVAVTVAGVVVFAVVPTVSPRHVHSESKNDGGMMYDKKFDAHGRVEHMRAAIVCP
jgi:hypothetical protein